MARAERSFILPDPSPKVWRIVSDISRWDMLFRPDSMLTSFKPQFRAETAGPLAAGARFSVMNKGRLAQSWEILDWNPPRSFKAGLVRWHAFLLKAEASLELELKPLDASSSQIRLRMDFQVLRPPFANFVWGSFIAHKSLDSALARWAERLALLLDEPG